MLLYWRADQVIAWYAYQAQRDDELSFAVNDIITVLDRSGSDWWRGQLRGQIGMFPYNYVAAVTEQEHVNSDLVVPLTIHRMYSAILRCVNELRTS